jgi:hypothetical protein
MKNLVLSRSLISFSPGRKGSMNRLIILVAILALVARFASAQPESSNLDTGKELVAQLYKEHSGKSDPLQYPSSKTLLPSYFSKPLLDLYLKDQEDSKGEVGKLDFDPLYDSQDFEISGFNLVVLPKKKGYWRPALRIWASTKKSSSHFSGQKWDGALLTFDTRTGVRFGRY